MFIRIITRRYLNKAMLKDIILTESFLSFFSYRVFGTKCSGCKKTIPANELVMRALGNVYHLHCFVCAMCGHVLEKGQEFALKDNKLYCKMDYAKLPKQSSRRSRINNNDNDSSKTIRQQESK